MPQEPKEYIHGHSPTVLKAHARRTAARDVAYLLPHLPPNATGNKSATAFKLLDIGCGPGTISADLANLLLPTGGAVTCLEISETALTAARQTFKERGLQNAEFVAGDVLALPFPDESFDVVHAHMVLIHIPDSVRAMAEMRRVLKAGGVLASKDMIMSTVTWHPFTPALSVWEVSITGTIAVTGADPDFGKAQKETALKAGFLEGEIRGSASSWSFTAKEDVDWWGGSVRSRLEGRESELRRKAVEGGYVTDAEVDGFVTAVGEWMVKKGAWFGVMNGEILCSKTS
jgi:SAM-dependent methyltransferase